VASGLSWRPGDSVVTTDLEFPANMYPWMNLRERGVEVRVVRSEDGRVPTERLVEACDATTRVVAISYVQFSTGFRSDLAALAEHCRPRGIMLVTDAIQAVGALPVDVHELGVDFYCRRELLERLRPTEVGQASVVERGSYLDYQFELLPSAARFECGVVNMQGVPGLQAALDLMIKVGRERIGERILRLNQRLADGLGARGYRLASPRAASEQSGIVSFRHDGFESAMVRERLHAAGVIVSLREGLVRVSPHFYNVEEDVERLLEALP
jgi:selenocysteine lyase/cysteine desulfurase